MERLEDEYLLRIEIMNDEITRLRKTLWETQKDTLLLQYTDEVVKRSLIYFGAIPSLNTYNRDHIELILEACEAAKTFFKDCKGNFGR